MIAKHLGEAFKQTVVVENRGGAGGLIGSQMVSRAAADGYTLVVSGIGSYVIAPTDAPSSFDPMKDFTHIAVLAGPTVADLIANQIQGGRMTLATATPHNQSGKFSSRNVVRRSIGPRWSR